MEMRWAFVAGTFCQRNSLSHEDLIELRRLQYSVPPPFQFLHAGLRQAFLSPGRQGAETPRQLASQYGRFALLPPLFPSFLPPLLQATFEAHAFNASDVR